jgi:hypothetical protein
MAQEISTMEIKVFPDDASCPEPSGVVTIGLYPHTDDETFFLGRIAGILELFFADVTMPCGKPPVFIGVAMKDVLSTPFKNDCPLCGNCGLRSITDPHGAAWHCDECGGTIRRPYPKPPPPTSSAPPPPPPPPANETTTKGNPPPRKGE